MAVEAAYEHDTLKIGDGASATLNYIVTDEGTSQSAMTALKAVVGETYTFENLTLYLKNITVEPVHIQADGNGGFDGVWEAKAEYGIFDGGSNDDSDAGGGGDPQTGDTTFSFDTGGGTTHITHGLSTQGSYLAPGLNTTPDWGGAINATDDGIEGVDITVPQYRFSETHYLTQGERDSYVGAWYASTGTVNDTTWGGFAPGTLMLLGVSGSKRGYGDWEVTFNFAAIPNETGLSVGDITGISKDGWDYLWVYYSDAVSSSGATLTKKPIAAYVSRVYMRTSFALGI